jgi:histidyl-tRNA synthetase
MPGLIQARVLKGFRDMLPEQEIERSLFIEQLVSLFRAWGFSPIDTPALEYAEILLGKGGGETEKQVYRFMDQGGRDVALRFDLTVPLARFVAEHSHELAFPFKRYHIAKVWRGENTQRGRYREFVQCDFDIVGSESLASDAEILLLMRAALSAIGAPDTEIRVSHRGLFNRFLARIGAEGQAVAVLRAVDKLSKIGKDAVLALLEESCPGKGEAILEFIGSGGGVAETLDRLEAISGGPSDESRRLRELFALFENAGALGSFVIDPSITRGLDYYTGIVYETYLKELPTLGSVCSGGRYDGLAGLYSKEPLSGIGASIGLDRLISGLESLGRSTRKASFSIALIHPLDESELARCFMIADRLRSEGIACEVYGERKKLAQLFAFAEKKGIAFALLVGGGAGSITLRDLTARRSVEGLGIQEAIAAIKASLPE